MKVPGRVEEKIRKAARMYDKYIPMINSISKELEGMLCEDINPSTLIRTEIVGKLPEGAHRIAEDEWAAKLGSVRVRYVELKSGSGYAAFYLLAV